MKAYSLDLRQRVVAAYEQGEGTLAELAALFRVSTFFIVKMLGLHRRGASSRGVILRGPEGAPTYASLFARIPGDWKYDWVDFARACRRSRWEGPQRLRIERGE